MHEHIKRLDLAVESGSLSPLAANRSVAMHAETCDVKSGKECNCKPRYMCVLKKKRLSAVSVFMIEDDGTTIEA